MFRSLLATALTSSAGAGDDGVPRDAVVGAAPRAAAVKHRLSFRHIVSAAAVSVVCVSTAGAAPLSVGYTDSAGGEWARLTDTVGLSWAQVNAVCPAAGGYACTASIGPVETLGWSFATLTQVRSLFQDFGVAPGGQPSEYAEVDSTWAPLAISALGATTQQLGFPQAIGITANLAAPTLAIFAFIGDRQPGLEDLASSNSITVANVGNPNHGVFLVRQATVPEPVTLVALTSALTACLLRVRRRR